MNHFNFYSHKGVSRFSFPSCFSVYACSVYTYIHTHSHQYSNIHTERRRERSSPFLSRPIKNGSTAQFSRMTTEFLVVLCLCRRRQHLQISRRGFLRPAHSLLLPLLLSVSLSCLSFLSSSPSSFLSSFSVRSTLFFTCICLLSWLILFLG